MDGELGLLGLPELELGLPLLELWLLDGAELLELEELDELELDWLELWLLDDELLELDELELEDELLGDGGVGGVGVCGVVGLLALGQPVRTSVHADTRSSCRSAPAGR